jgi:thioesterase domain-containing protein
MTNPQHGVMTPHDLDTYLHSRIPLAKFMRVSVVEVKPDRLVITAPLEPNANVHQTLFGGSAASIALIAAWSLLFTRMSAMGVTGTVVVHKHSMTYVRPVTGRFTAEARFATPESWQHFVEALDHKGRARIGLDTMLHFEGQEAAHLKGEFVASRRTAT